MVLIARAQSTGLGAADKPLPDRGTLVLLLHIVWNTFLLLPQTMSQVVFFVKVSLAIERALCIASFLFRISTFVLLSASGLYDYPVLHPSFVAPVRL